MDTKKVNVTIYLLFLHIYHKAEYNILTIFIARVLNIGVRPDRTEQADAG